MLVRKEKIFICLKCDTPLLFDQKKTAQFLQNTVEIKKVNIYSIHSQIIIKVKVTISKGNWKYNFQANKSLNHVYYCIKNVNLYYFSLSLCNKKFNNNENNNMLGPAPSLD